MKRRLLNLLVKMIMFILLVVFSFGMAREAHRYYIGEFVKKECLR